MAYAPIDLLSTNLHKLKFDFEMKTYLGLATDERFIIVANPSDLYFHPNDGFATNLINASAICTKKKVEA